MTKRILFPLITATAIALLPSCGDDDEDGDNGGTTTGGRAASGGATASGGSGGRTGGTTGTGGAINPAGGNNDGGAGEPVAGAGGESTTGTGGGTADAGAANAGSGGIGLGGASSQTGGSGGQAGAIGEPGGAGGDDDGTAGAAGAGGAVAELTDAQILHVTAVTNQGEIEQGTVGIERAQNDDVQAYAAMMVSEHGAALATGSTLAQQLGLSSNPISVELQTESASIVAQLQGAPEAEFDELYIASQVAVHQQALALLDEELIPQADSDELSNYLDTIRASVAAHLEEAEELLEQLN